MGLAIGVGISPVFMDDGGGNGDTGHQINLETGFAILQENGFKILIE